MRGWNRTFETLGKDGIGTAQDALGFLETLSEIYVACNFSRKYSISRIVPQIVDAKQNQGEVLSGVHEKLRLG